MGSGGGWGGSKPPKIPFEELAERAGQDTDQAQYDSEVEQFLRDTLSDYNDRDVDTIQKHLETIKDAISKDIEGTIDLLFGGSSQKHTYVNGLSDVDMLVLLNDSSLSNKEPKEVMRHFEQVLRDRLFRTEITVGDLAVTVTFSDAHKIQLLPAVSTGTGFRIPKPGENQWSNVISPRRFAQRLTQVNQRLAGNVVPVIKLFKGLNETLPKQDRLSGYHIESLAIESFESYKGRMTKGEMLRHLINQSEHRVLRPITDSTGQSRHVDDYLGNASSEDRKRVSKSLSNLLKRIERADNLRSIEKWHQMFEL